MDASASSFMTRPPSKRKTDEAFENSQTRDSGATCSPTQVEGQVEHSGSSGKRTTCPAQQKNDEAAKKLQTHGTEVTCKPIQRDAEKELDHTTNEEQDEYWALTDKPYFYCVLAKSQVKSTSCIMGLPSKMSQLLPEEEVPVIISCRNKKWKMKYYGNRSFKRFDPSWKNFVNDNKLKVGDGCVFELVDYNKKCIKFRVQILDGEIPSEFLKRVDGETLNHPIVIE